MAPVVKKVVPNIIKIGKVAFGKLPENMSPTVVYGIAAVLVLLVVYFVYSTMNKTTSIVSNGKSSPKKSSPKKVAVVAPAPVTTNGNGNGKESKTPKKTPSKGKVVEAPPTPVDNTARKSERLRGKTPKKWD